MLTDEERIYLDVAINHVTRIISNALKRDGMAEQWEAAQEAAVELIGNAGYDPSDSDQYGNPIEDNVQALVTAAVALAPHIATL